MSEIDRAELRRLLDEATPRPWEFGDRQFRARVVPELFGEGRCAYCSNPDRPLVHTGRGKNPWHVHEVERPWWDHGIYAYRASGSSIVVHDTDEYGYMADEDARIIVAAVNALPDLLDALDVAGSAIERVRALHVRRDEWCGHHKSTICEVACAYCYECKADWPCPTIQALDGGGRDE